MSLRKLCFFALLCLVVIFEVVPTFDIQAKKVGVLTPNSRPYHPAVAHSDSRLLPVQSQNPDDLGAGKLLVASRTLGDPNFAETVVLLVHRDAEGVVGLILNRRTNVPLLRLLEEFEAAKDRSDPVYLGGPVETQAVLALLGSKAKLDEAEQVLSGVSLISTKTLFEKAISGRPDPGIFHVYLGYAGWSNDQLRKEVELGSWFIFQGDARTIFDSDPDSLWRQMIQKTEVKLAALDPHAPEQFGAKRKLRS